MQQARATIADLLAALKANPQVLVAASTASLLRLAMLARRDSSLSLAEVPDVLRVLGVPNVRAWDIWKFSEALASCPMIEEKDGALTVTNWTQLVHSMNEWMAIPKITKTLQTQQRTQPTSAVPVRATGVTKPVKTQKTAKIAAKKLPQKPPPKATNRKPEPAKIPVEPEQPRPPTAEVVIARGTTFEFASREMLLALLSGATVAPSHARLVGQAHALALAGQFEELLSPARLLGVDVHRYQHEAVLRVLRRMRGRAMLSDEVGLGKTVEAMMVLCEYQLRGMASRALLLVPAALSAQWAGELLAKC